MTEPRQAGGPAGRRYAAYGGMYVAMALVWLWLVVGAGIALAGMAVIALQPNGQ